MLQSLHQTQVTKISRLMSDSLSKWSRKNEQITLLSTPLENSNILLLCVVSCLFYFTFSALTDSSLFCQGFLISLPNQVFLVPYAFCLRFELDRHDWDFRGTLEFVWFYSNWRFYNLFDYFEVKSINNLPMPFY